MSEDKTDERFGENKLLQDKPAYGALDNYSSKEKGEAYFTQQDLGGLRAAKYNYLFFEPYMSDLDTVLDFGCGGGHLLARLPGCEKVGIDINPAARVKAESQGIDTYAKLSDLSGRKFTRIITSHALEHIPNPYGALCDMKDLLQEDGLLIWLSPMDDWHNKRQRRWQPNDFDMHLYAWTPLTMGNLLTSASFRVQSLKTIDHAIPPRVGDLLWSISPTVFKQVASLWAAISNRRQLLAVAQPIKEK